MEKSIYRYTGIMGILRINKSLEFLTLHVKSMRWEVSAHHSRCAEHPVMSSHLNRFNGYFFQK